MYNQHGHIDLYTAWFINYTQCNYQYMATWTNNELYWFIIIYGHRNEQQSILHDLLLGLHGLKKEKYDWRHMVPPSIICCFSPPVNCNHSSHGIMAHRPEGYWYVMLAIFHFPTHRLSYPIYEFIKEIHNHGTFWLHVRIFYVIMMLLWSKTFTAQKYFLIRRGGSQFKLKLYFDLMSLGKKVTFSHYFGAEIHRPQYQWQIEFWVRKLTYTKIWKFYDNILKNMSNAWKLRKTYFCPVDKKMISPLFEWCIRKYLGLCTIFIQTSRCYIMFMVYHAVI